MIGKNQLLLNGATMNQAVQLWLSGIMKDCPKVTDVIYDQNETAFVISLESGDV